MKRNHHGLDQERATHPFNFLRNTPNPQAGFTVMELLVILVLLILLTTLTLRPIGKGKDPAEVERAAYQLAQDLEKAQSQARAERSAWYWIIPAESVTPSDAAFQGYQFVSSIDPLPEEVDWVRFPKELAFAPDTDSDVLDLLLEQPLLEYTRNGSFESVTGTFRVLMAILPDGSFRVGPDRELASTSLRVARGSWAGGVYLDHEEGGQPVRLRFRPRTGVVKVEVGL